MMASRLAFLSLGVDYLILVGDIASHRVVARCIELMDHPWLGARLTCVIFWKVVATAVAIIPIFELIDKIEVVGPVAPATAVVAIVSAVAIVAVVATVAVVMIVVVLVVAAVALVVVVGTIQFLEGLPESQVCHHLLACGCHLLLQCHLLL